MNMADIKKVPSTWQVGNRISMFGSSLAQYINKKSHHSPREWAGDTKTAGLTFGGVVLRLCNHRETPVHDLFSFAEKRNAQGVHRRFRHTASVGGARLETL